MLQKPGWNSRRADENLAPPAVHQRQLVVPRDPGVPTHVHEYREKQKPWKCQLLRNLVQNQPECFVNKVTDADIEEIGKPANNDTFNMGPRPTLASSPTQDPSKWKNRCLPYGHHDYPGPNPLQHKTHSDNKVTENQSLNVSVVSKQS
jgi:hypothetical protein